MKELNFKEKIQFDLIFLDPPYQSNYIANSLEKIEEYTSYSTLRIKHSPKDVLIPFVKAFIKSVSLEEKKIVVNYIEGLL